MNTSEVTLRYAQSKAVEAAGSRSYRPNAPTRAPEREEENRKNIPEDIPEEELDEEAEDESRATSNDARLASLPEIATGDDLTFDFGSFSFMKPTTREVEEKVHKRASNVLKLTQENEKLQAQLKAMADQLEEMERQRAELAAKEQKLVEKSSS